MEYKEVREKWNSIKHRTKVLTYCPTTEGWGRKIGKKGEILTNYWGYDGPLGYRTTPFFSYGEFFYQFRWEDIIDIREATPVEELCDGRVPPCSKCGRATHHSDYSWRHCAGCGHGTDVCTCDPIMIPVTAILQLNTKTLKGLSYSQWDNLWKDIVSNVQKQKED